MTLTDLIKDMKEKGLISVAPIRLIGKAKPVLSFVSLMATTRPIESIEGNDFNQARN